MLTARLAGVTVVAEDPFVLASLAEVVDWRPRFDAVAINVPIGLFDEPTGPYRPCDEQARAMVGWPRRTAFAAVPSRAALHADRRDALAMEPWLKQSDLRRFRWLREADHELQPFHQRSYFSAQPDLSFHHLNGDRPLRSSPYQDAGVVERLQLVRAKLPGTERYITELPPTGAGQIHVLQSTALLWTARRAAGRAMSRLPAEPTWDSTGLRMDLVR